MARTPLYPHLDTLVNLRVVDDSLHHPHRRESCVRPIRPTRQHEDDTSKHMCPRVALDACVHARAVVRIPHLKGHASCPRDAPCLYLTSCEHVSDRVCGRDQLSVCPPHHSMSPHGPFDSGDRMSDMGGLFAGVRHIGHGIPLKRQRSIHARQKTCWHVPGHHVRRCVRVRITS